MDKSKIAPNKQNYLYSTGHIAQLAATINLSKKVRSLRNFQIIFPKKNQPPIN